MARVFHRTGGPWARYAPARLQAALSMPTPIASGMVGRVELCIGRLGAGKTTWAALRARRIAEGRTLATTGQGWPEPWVCVASFDELHALERAVLVLDEVHLLLPSTRGLLGRDEERGLLRFLSLVRKREVCVIGTTQAWTRVATHYRNLVTTVWVCEPITRGVLHRATPFEHPDDGGLQVFGPQYFGPAAARIPTNAAVWYGQPDERPGAAPAAPAVEAADPEVEEWPAWAN